MTNGQGVGGSEAHRSDAEGQAGRTDHAQVTLSTLLARVDFGQPSTASLRAVDEFFERLLDVKPDTVYATTVSKNGNLTVRFEQSDRARRSPIGLAVLYKDATRPGAALAAKRLIERPGNAKQAIVLCEALPTRGWTVTAVVEADGGTVSERLRQHFELIEVVAAKKAAETSTSGSEVTSGPQSWLVMQSERSKYRDVEGKQYHYPLGIPNSLQIREGDLLICHRPSYEASEGERIFGLGRVGAIEPDGERGRVARYDRYLSVDPPLSFEQLGGEPRNNRTNAIDRVPPEFGDRLLERLGLESIDDLPPVEDDEGAELVEAQGGAAGRAEVGFEAFTFDEVARVAIDQELYVSNELIATAVAALRSGKHLIVIGPPGTGKTSFAQVLAEVARLSGTARGWMVVTATADWTSADTVGGYRLGRTGELYFRSGCVLEAIDANGWLIIDELNRADVDKAFGQLFTVLSGQAVTLPFVEDRDGVERAPSLVPDGAAEPIDTHVHRVSRDWRIIATLNTRDRDFLFRMSYALLRRFAVIEMANPPKEIYEELLAAKAPTGSDELDEAIAAMIELPERSLGPAILLDCARFVAARRALGVPADHGEREAFVGEAIRAFGLPQLDDLTPQQLQRVVRHVHDKVLAGTSMESTAKMFAAGLGFGVGDLLPASEEAMGDVDGGDDE